MNKKWIIGIVAVITIVIGIILLQEDEASTEIETARIVTIDQVTTGSMSKAFKVNGTVQDTFETFDGSLIQGKVSKVLVKKGDSVEIGTPLIQLDTTGDYDSLDFQIKQLTSSISELRLLVNQTEEQKSKQEQLFSIGASTKEEIKAIDNQLSQYRLQISKQTEQVEQLNKSKDNSSTKSVIKSSCKGIVTELSIEEGGFVTGSDVLKIKKTQHQIIEMHVTEKYLKEISVGMKVDVNVNGENIIGVVDDIKESSNLLYPVKIKIDSDHTHGLSAVITIPIYENSTADLLVDRAIIKYGGESYVFCVEDGVVVKKTVVVGMSKNGKTEIISGLTGDDSVVVKGQFSIHEGEAVEVENE